MQQPSLTSSQRSNPTSDPGMADAPGTNSRQAPEASTSVNIAIQDSKDFPPEVAPLQELYSEFIMADGRVLFECPQLIKTTGIDLMNCPLNLVLKLRVRRRQPQGSVVLWHVVLPLPLISKYLLNPPHEWETWIGLLPNTQNLDLHPPDTMFTQSVHLISRPEFPKLRLRFTYHNPQLKAQLQSQQQQQQQEARRRMELTQQVGRAQFEEIQKLTRSVRSTGAGKNGLDSTASSQPESGMGGTFGSRASAEGEPPRVEAGNLLVDDGGRMDEVDRLRDSLMSCLGFLADTRNVLAARSAQSGQSFSLPSALDRAEVLAGAGTPSYLDNHCGQLLQCLQQAAHSGSAPASTDTEADALAEEGARMAMMGMLAGPDIGGAGELPRTAAHLSLATNEQMASLRCRFPHLWDRLLDVSQLANQRAALMDGQAQAMQIGFDAEAVSLRRQLQERDAELARLREQLGDKYDAPGTSVLRQQGS